jgi:flagellin
MIINHNMNAINANRMLGVNGDNQAKSIEKLSSGLRIARAGDDAAGLAISEKMRGQIRGLEQASRNAQDSISLIQTAEGALQETHAILQRMRELTVQATNDTNVTADRSAIADEITELTNELNRISSQTEFNTQNLIDGTFSQKTFQIGANRDQIITLTINDMHSTALNVHDIKNQVSNAQDATVAISTVNTAIETVSKERSKLGAYQNRLEHNIKNLDTAAENLQSSESRVRDVDMAKEMMTFSKNNILSQAAQSMLSQANQQPQSVLSLLR